MLVKIPSTQRTSRVEPEVDIRAGRSTSTLLSLEATSTSSSSTTRLKYEHNSNRVFFELFLMGHQEKHLWKTSSRNSRVDTVGFPETF